MSINGILNVHKPPNYTSFQVVRFVRSRSLQRRVGHGGTLDPLATGVLPVCLGQATRVAEYLAETSKVYRAEVMLGVSTDTYDAQGQVTATGDPSSVTLIQVERALESFRGVIEQTPPMYSAVKHKGKPLYQSARAGIQVERQRRKAHVSQLKLLAWKPPQLTLEVECGKGTYIRSIAHDLGQVLGCGAHLKSLVRLRSGPFLLEDALTLPELEEAFNHGYWQDLLYPLDIVLLNWKAAIFGPQVESMVRNGHPLQLETSQVDEKCRAYSIDGQLLALLFFEAKVGRWHPRKVLCVGEGQQP